MTGRRLAQLADLPVSTLHGVGTVAARELAELGIESVLDLLTHYPRRYVDGTRMLPIDGLAEGENASVLAGSRGRSARRCAAAAAGDADGCRAGSKSTSPTTADACGSSSSTSRGASASCHGGRSCSSSER